MWRPNRAQGSIIWTVAVLVVLGWPPDKGRSLFVKALNWGADSADSLPALPRQLLVGVVVLSALGVWRLNGKQ